MLDDSGQRRRQGTAAVEQWLSCAGVRLEKRRKAGFSTGGPAPVLKTRRQVTF